MDATSIEDGLPILSKALAKRVAGQESLINETKEQLNDQNERIQVLEDTCKALILSLKDISNAGHSATTGEDLSEYIQAQADSLVERLTKNSVSEFDLNSSEGIHSGYVYKLTSGKGLASPRWKKRWFIVKEDGQILYYKNPKESRIPGHPANFLDLRRYKIIPAEESELSAHKVYRESAFQASAPGERTFYFYAHDESEEAKEKWIKAFQFAAAKRSGTLSGVRGLDVRRGSATVLNGIGERQTKIESQASNNTITKETPTETQNSNEPTNKDVPDFSCSSESLDAATCHGWLQRKEAGGGWGKIYFVLDGPYLFSFNNPSAQTALTATQITGCVIDIVFEDDIERGLSIEKDGMKKIVLNALNDDDYSNWVACLTNTAQAND
eukprot:m.72409 g.72409  ORF g.72409 m.72409 type:complete len:384 (-) comp12324_c0_seq1:160-1311(-)